MFTLLNFLKELMVPTVTELSEEYEINEKIIITNVIKNVVK